jgi:hypothetical protein
VRTVGLVIVAALAALAGGPSAADVTLELEDGQRIEGRSFERNEGFYYLTLENGNVLPVPQELVRAVRPAKPPAPTGLVLAEPRTLAGALDGQPVLPSYADQVRVLQDSTSVFRRNIIDPFWQPTSDWDNDLAQNDFHPVHWYRPPIDPQWTPTSGLGRDVTEFNPARWYRAPIDPTWWPEDGFAWRKE